MPKPQPKPMIRKGKQCAILPDGHPRRMSDAKNAFRKMTADQREAFVAWIYEEDGSVIVSLTEDLSS